MTSRRTSDRPGRWGVCLTVATLVLGPACAPTENPGGEEAEAGGQAPDSIPRTSTATPAPPDTSQGAPTAVELARANASRAALRPVTTEWTGGAAPRGKEVYDVHCVTCHGAGGQGDGQAAAALNPKPRDFTTGVYYIDGDADAETGEPEDLARVIVHGPATFGGSNAMPPWGQSFNDQQIRDLVAYLRTFAEGGGG